MAIKFAPNDEVRPDQIRTDRVKTIDEIKAAVAKSAGRRKKPTIAQKTKIVADQINAETPSSRGRPKAAEKNDTIAIRLPIELVTKIKATKDWQKIAKKVLAQAF